MKREWHLRLACLVFPLGVLSGAATASPDARMNQCWGDIASQVGQEGVMGQHSRAKDPLGRPESQPRLGVANQGRFLEDNGIIEEGDPGQGGIGNHAIVVGGLFGTLPGEEPLTCDRASQ